MKDDRRSYCYSKVGLHSPTGPGAGHQEERTPVAAGRLQDVVAGEERSQQDGLRAIQLRGEEEQPEEGLPREEPEGHASPVTSPCLSRRQGRTSISRCSSWTMSTASGSGAFTPWTSWWNTTKRRPSSPASMGRSSTSSERSSDGPAPLGLRCHPHSQSRQMPGRRRPRSPAEGPLCRWCGLYWLLCLVYLFVQVGLLPPASPGPSQALTPTVTPLRSGQLESGRWRRGGFVHFIPSPLGTAFVCSRCSCQENPPPKDAGRGLNAPKLPLLSALQHTQKVGSSCILGSSWGGPRS
uniref:NCK adaptor protein 2 n=1 Tax=Equus caballus TaxID=9796 RepID=F7BRP0_HORSE